MYGERDTSKPLSVFSILPGFNQNYSLKDSQRCPIAAISVLPDHPSAPCLLGNPTVLPAPARHSNNFSIIMV